jgi:hypothetical protein
MKTTFKTRHIVWIILRELKCKKDILEKPHSEEGSSLLIILCVRARVCVCVM